MLNEQRCVKFGNYSLHSWTKNFKIHFFFSSYSVNQMPFIASFLLIVFVFYRTSNISIFIFIFIFNEIFANTFGGFCLVFVWFHIFFFIWLSNSVDKNEFWRKSKTVDFYTFFRPRLPVLYALVGILQRAECCFSDTISRCRQWKKSSVHFACKRAQYFFDYGIRVQQNSQITFWLENNFQVNVHDADFFQITNQDVGMLLSVWYSQPHTFSMRYI